MKELSLNVTTMSSREIAELTGKEHKNVLVDIRNMLTELGNLAADFSATRIDDRGKEYPIFNLPKRETLILVSGYSIPMRTKIIDRWQELESQLQPSYQIEDPIKRAEQWIVEQKQRIALEKLNAAQAEAIADLRIELDESMDWFSIKKIAEYNSVKWQDLNWRPLKKHGIAHGLVPRKVFDANFPDGVNVYHRDSWYSIYPKLDLPGEGQ